MSIQINDSRLRFTKTTFSNYKKTNVINELSKTIYYQKVEDSFFWTCELLCSGYIIDIWNVYISFMCKYIHVCNPKLPMYIEQKFQEFRSIAKTSKNDLELRNNIKLRTLFCTITLILCNSKKESTLENLKLKLVFDIELLSENLKAPNIEYIQSVWKEGDPSEYMISLNELIYHLKETSNKIDIFYWIDWIIEYDNILHKKKKDITIAYRKFIPVNNKNLVHNIIWILWDILFEFVKNEYVKKKIIHSLFELFCIKYTRASNSKKKGIIYFSIAIIIDKKIDYDIKILENNEHINNISHNINVIFEQLKKNEVITDLTKKEHLSSKEKKEMLYKEAYFEL